MDSAMPDISVLALPSADALPQLADVVVAQIAGIPVHAMAGAPRDAARAVLAWLLALPRPDALVTFANPATAVLARNAPTFRQDLSAFDLVLPDGIGMCMAVQFVHGVCAPRISFDMTSLAPIVFEHAGGHGLRVVLVGGQPGVAARAGRQLAQHYPSLQLVGIFDGFSDPACLVRRVAALQPDIVICGLGSGRQEALLLLMRAQGWCGWGFTCGGFLDQLEEGLDYYPRWIDRAQLRWAYRLVREPGRLWRRYLIDYTRFALIVAAARASGAARPETLT